MALKKQRGSNKSKGLCKLAISEEMTINVIDELKQGLSAEIDLYECYELNLADVEEIDSAGIQLLLTFSRELALNHKSLRLTTVSAVVAELLENYGLSKRFTMGNGA